MNVTNVSHLFRATCLLLCLAGAAHARQTEAPAKKANARPTAEATPAPEPFDKATVEQMSKQCVTLDTEAGVVEIEMLAEGAPETVRNFLNLAAMGRVRHDHL